MLVTVACLVAAAVIVLPFFLTGLRQWYLLRNVPCPPVTSLILGHAPKLMSYNRRGVWLRLFRLHCRVHMPSV